MKNPFFRIFFLPTLFISIILSVTGCKKAATDTVVVSLPAVATDNAIVNLTATTAQSGGIVSSTGNGTISADGVCYSSTNKIPTIADTKTSDPTAVTGETSNASYTSNLSNLTPGTTYYLRAYVTNSAGTAYGGVLTFTTSATLSAVITTVSTFAGNGSSGYADGQGLGALFNNPQAVTVDSKGNIYVSDSFNGLIRLVTPAAAVSTFAGTPSAIGFVNGPAASAQFYAPSGSVFDAQGNLYVSDFGNNVIRKITPGGIVSTFAGSGVAGYRNGAVDSAHLKNPSDSLAMFNSPQGLAIDAAGNIYVADRGNNVIRKILPTGRTVTFAGTRTAGFIDGTDELASFNNPTGVAVDVNGNVYVTDQGNSSLREITPGEVVSTLVGGPLQLSLLNYPSAITIDKTGNLYLVDEGGRIFEYTPAKVLYILAGTSNNSGFVNGAGTAASFNNPQGIAVDPNGNIYVADQGNNCIRLITVTTQGGAI
jgi:sugar lactone lactonase YvrE